MQTFAFEPEPLGVNIVEYGIFDPNDNNTNLLKVGEKYDIKVIFESDLDESVSFTYFVQVIDKNKNIHEIVDEFSISGTLKPGETNLVSFAWTPKYEGKFRTFSGVSDDSTNTTIGGVPQFDFATMRDATERHDYFPTYQIINLENQYSADQPFVPQILKKDLDACNAYYAEILKDKVRIWEYTYASFCVVMEPPEEMESIIDVPKTKDPIMLSETGEYLLKVRIGHYLLQENFFIVGDDAKIATNNIENNDLVCGIGTEQVDGTCQVVKTEKTKTIGSDAPFFGIFAYLDEFFSWMFGK